ncbi:MAG: TorF family putative porin, partial [Betaproteobacteria bacterium]|nr:TorF family putative porin [Betaproteobacteria bacterium]
DTLELYGALSWKWLSLKYSHSLSDETFGVKDSDGTYYLDLTATFPVTDKFSIIGHYGQQKFNGSGGACGAGADNNSCASYKDWKIGATYALPQSFTIGGYFTGTDMTTAQKAFYTNGADAKWVGKDAYTLLLSKTF